jgi:hypothetical protein
MAEALLEPLRDELTVVGFERYGMLSDIEYIHEKQRLENYRFEIVEMGGKLSKEDRIRRLIPIFENGRFYLPTSLWRVTLEGTREDLVAIFVEQEYKPFPVAVHDDFFDAISRICDAEVGTAWPRAAAKKVNDRYARARRRQRSYSHWAAWGQIIPASFCRRCRELLACLPLKSIFKGETAPRLRPRRCL